MNKQAKKTVKKATKTAKPAKTAKKAVKKSDVLTFLGKLAKPVINPSDGLATSDLKCGRLTIRVNTVGMEFVALLYIGNGKVEAILRGYGRTKKAALRNLESAIRKMAKLAA